MKRHLVAAFGFAVAAALGAASGCGSDTGLAGEETTAQGEAMNLASTTNRVNPPEMVAASHFELDGVGLHVTYTASADLPVLVYQDTEQSLTVRGGDVHITATEVGTLVSVVIHRTIDTGGTTFGVLIPRVRVASNGSAPVETQGITTVRRYFAGAILGGQLDRYTFTSLEGTARAHAIFEVPPVVIPSLPPVIRVPPELVPSLPALKARPELIPEIPAPQTLIPGTVPKLPVSGGEGEPGS